MIKLVLVVLLLSVEFKTNRSATVLQIMKYDICNDTLIFNCSRNSSFFRWMIFSGSSRIYSLGLSSHDNIGHKYNFVHFKSSTIYAEIIAANSTYIVSRLTILNASYLFGSNIVCNEREVVHDYTNTEDILPDVITLRVSVENFSISWNSSRQNMYHLEVFIAEGLTDTIITEGSSIILNENYTIQNISIYICPTHFEVFTIDPCLFNTTNYLFENNFIIYSNGSWSIACRDEYLMVNSCYPNGIWIYDLCPGSGPFTSSSSFLGSIDNVEQANTAELIRNSKARYSEEVTNATATSSLELRTLLILVIIPTGIVFCLVSVIIISILSLLFLRNRGKKLLPISSSPAPTTDVPVYEHIGNCPFNNISDTRQNLPIQVPSEGDYSTLHHKKVMVCTNDEYSTIQNPVSSNGRRVKEMEYAEIKSCTHCGNIKPFTDYKVKYANICSSTLEADNLLNIETLVLQLQSISEHFKLFGSVAGISPVSLDQIIAKSKSSYDGLAQVCDLWLQKCQQEQTSPTWHAVAEILALINQNELSNNILQVYATGKLPVEVDMKSGVQVKELQEEPQYSKDSEPKCSLQILQGSNKDCNAIKLDLKDNTSEDLKPVCQEKKVHVPQYSLVSLPKHSSHLKENEQEDETSDDELPPPVPPYNPTSSEQPNEACASL